MDASLQDQDRGRARCRGSSSASTSTSSGAGAVQGPSRTITLADGTVKLRNSCEACAASKLKCSRDRPTCTRCAKRKIPCDYSAMRKAGRKPNSHQHGAAESQRIDGAAHPPAGGVGRSSRSSGSDSSKEPSTPPEPPLPSSVTGGAEMNIEDYFDPSFSFSSDVNDLDMTIDYSDFISGNNDFFSNSPLETFTQSFWGTQDYVANVLHPAAVRDLAPVAEMSLTSDFVPVAPVITNNGFAPVAPMSADSYFVPVALMSSTSDKIPQIREPQPKRTQCSCLSQALAIMTQLTALHAAACASWSPKSDHLASGRPSAQAVVSQNESALESLNGMLHCGCLEDGYLVNVVALIILKVLCLYAEVARSEHIAQSAEYEQSSLLSSANSDHPMRDFHLDSEDSARFTAQLVLGKLHRVQRFIDQFSPKLKTHAAKTDAAAKIEVFDPVETQSQIALPLSGIIYDQLETDLRRRLKVVSWGIIDHLNRL